MTNPVIAELRRGGVTESQHRGAYAVVDAQGVVAAQAGAFEEAFFPRSAIKAFQCLPLIESGGAKAFNLNDEEIALCCASHGGETEHVRVARAILAKAGIAETCYECGAHFPTARHAANDLIRAGEKPLSVHNNCSGKHAGMLALAKHLGAPLEGYVAFDHPVQMAVADCLSRYTGVDVAKAPRGIDGCSVPTYPWAAPKLAPNNRQCREGPLQHQPQCSETSNQPPPFAPDDQMRHSLPVVHQDAWLKPTFLHVFLSNCCERIMVFHRRVSNHWRRGALLGNAHHIHSKSRLSQPWQEWRGPRAHVPFHRRGRRNTKQFLHRLN